MAPDEGFEQLAKEYATRGGINEQVVRDLAERNVFGLVADSLDAVHQRITEKPE